MAAIPQVLEPSPVVGVETGRSPFLPLLPWLLIAYAGLTFSACSLLWQIWTNDALRSIGIYLPIASLILTLRVWRRCNWETRGTWWGLLPLFYGVMMTRAGGNALQIFIFGGHTSISLLQSGLTVYAYGCGIVLLLGGVGVWRRAAFPLALLLFVNPVPSVFAQIDLPLQYLCAHTAHTFALAIGVHPEGNQLRLMFAPGFGMFIAPGCDGVRGAVTMGYLALILGYVYRFSFRARLAAAFGAVALGYLFNLIRLCVLVLFYGLALRFPFLQARGEGADYLIGGILFLSAAALFANLVRSQRRSPAEENEPRNALQPSPNGMFSSAGLVRRGVALTVLVILGSFSYLHGLVVASDNQAGMAMPQARLANLLPAEIGGYKLIRTWTEPDAQNRPTYQWGSYSAGKTLNDIDVAYWLGGGAHYPIRCHLARGEKPAWRRTQALRTGNGESAVFDLDFYEQDRGGVLEASTTCDRGGCNAQVLLPAHAGIAFVGMGMTNFLFRPTSTPLPLLMREETFQPNVSSEAMRNSMFYQMRGFITAVNTNSLIHFSETGQ